MKTSFKIQRKIRNYIYNNKKRFGRYTPSKGQIFHCTIQKAASSWFVNLFSDPEIFSCTNRPVHRPGKDFIEGDRELLQNMQAFPEGSVISPLYIGFEDYSQLDKEPGSKAFYVMRDPRDFAVSHYFSIRYSHGASSKVTQVREELEGLSDDEGLLNRISELGGYFDSMREWSQCDGSEAFLCKYEDLFGQNQISEMKRLFDYLEIDISEKKLERVLNRFSFNNISGRNPGTENNTNHYRKGIAGDWVNHFNERHKAALKEVAGQTLIDLGYENNLDW